MQLPEDPAILQEMVRELLDRLARSEHNQEQLRRKVEDLLRRLCGSTSERVNPNQLLLFGELTTPEAQCPPIEPEAPPAVPRRRGHGRRRIPESLERRRVVHELSEVERLCPCCGVPMVAIREEISEQLDYEPASLYVAQHVRPVYACARRCQEAPVIAPPPVKPIDKGLPGPGLMAHIALSKYGNHLPLYRLQGILEAHGASLSRSTMCGWIAEMALMLAPIVSYMTQDLLKSRVIATDETPVKVLDRLRMTTFQGRLWVYVGDRAHPWLVYDYTPTRERDGPKRFLSGYRGFLQADAYGGYDGLYVGNLIAEVACWMHCRRYWFKASEVEANRPMQMLAMIRRLYQIEKACKGFAATDRRSYREEHATPILDTIHAWLQEHRPGFLPKSPLGDAARYTTNQWDALRRYAHNGDLEIDNGRSERALRLIAVGRRNWLFFGSPEGGPRAATLYSLIGTCKLHHLDPEAYLRDVLRVLPSHPASRIHELTPLAWAGRSVAS